MLHVILMAHTAGLARGRHLHGGWYIFALFGLVALVACAFGAQVAGPITFDPSGIDSTADEVDTPPTRVGLTQAATPSPSATGTGVPRATLSPSATAMARY